MSSGRVNDINNVIPKSEHFLSAPSEGNARFTSFALALCPIDGKRIDLYNPDVVSERLKYFLQTCMDYDIKPGVASMALVLGVSRNDIYDIVTGDVNSFKNLPEESRYTIKNVYSIMESLWEDYMMHGKVNPASGIFLGKNHYGYKDVSDFTISQNTTISDTPDAIAKKYDAIPLDDEEQ